MKYTGPILYHPSLTSCGFNINKPKIDQNQITMIQTKMITVEIDGMLGETEVEFTARDFTNINLITIDGQPADNYSFSDQMAITSQLVPLMIRGNKNAGAAHE